mgnify:CR=1 FL=1
MQIVEMNLSDLKPYENNPRNNQEAVDYVVVHELAHIRHHNHSKDFYSFVSEFMPDYKEREKLLKTD